MARIHHMARTHPLRRGAFFSTRRFLLCVGAALAGMCFLCAGPARAITINLTPVDLGNNPNVDLDGTGLDAIMDYVAGVYHDIIEDTNTLELTYSWDSNLTSFAGQHQFGTELNGKEVTANIRFNPARSWFVDPTPADDSEYTMSQVLYNFGPNALSVTQKANRFSGTVTDVFEAGYNGPAVPGGDADGLLDLVTLAFQEIGHALGMSSSFSGTLIEVADLNGNLPGGVFSENDFDYDVNPVFVRNDVMALLPRGTTSGDGIAHLNGNDAAMSSLGSDRRVKASAADIFALAAGSNWTSIDLPRQDFLGGGTWNTPGNWMGNQTPGAADDAYVRLGDSIGLSANDVVGSLTVDNNSFVVTLANKLDVVKTATIQSTSTINRSQIWVTTGGELEADDLVINSGGDLKLENGLADVNTLTLNDDATLFGRGTVDVATSLNNNGSIEATTGLTLTLTTASVFGIWDLDGTSGNGVVRAVSGDLVVQGGLSDAFDGIMVIGANHYADFDTAWTLGSGGRLELIGNATDPADMRGSTLTVLGDLQVSDRGLISAPVTFGSTADVSILGPDGRLSLTGPTTLLSGGSYTGREIQFDNTVNVNGNVTLSTTIADLDGNNGSTTINVNNGTFSVNTSFLDDNNNFFDGTINVIFGAKFAPDVDGTSWNLRGTLNLGGVDGFLTLPLAGDDVNVLNTGTISVDGPVRIEAVVHLNGGSIQTADALTDVILSTASNTISGGSVDGPGQLSASSGVELRGFGTINTSIGFGGTSMLIAENGTLSINGTLTDVGTLGTNGPASVLEVNSFWNTNAADQVVLNQGQLTGGTVTNGGTITGRGLIAAAGLRNNGTLSANGGGLFIDVTSVLLLDLDGTNNAGVIEAVNGSVQVDNDFAAIQSFNGTLTVGTGQEYRMLFDGLDNTGQVTLTGGTYVAPLFQQSGNMTVQTSPSVLESSSIFNPASVTLIHANLRLVGTTVVEAGAAVSGAATLINTAGSHLQLKNGALLGVDLQNDGSMEVGDSAGIADVRGIVTLSSTSAVIEELEGTALGAYDRLEITESAALDGSLRVVFGRAFVPMVGDFFDIIEADLGVSGAFSSVLFPAIPNAGMGIQYNPTTARLLVGLIGDLNFDGFVGIEDLNIVLGGWNGNVNAGVWGLGDPSGDGFVGIEDLNTVLGNWNAGIPPAAQASGTVPEPGTLSLLALSSAIVCRRRRVRCGCRV
jgi:hypothetical protein